MKYNTQSRRLTRKLTVLRQDAWQLTKNPLGEQHIEIDSNVVERTVRGLRT